MKTPLLLIFLFLTLMGSMNAQNRRSGMGQGMRDPGQNTSRKAAEPVDQVQSQTDFLVKELNLDGFQAAIVKNIIQDFVDKTANIALEAIPDQGKQEKMQLEIDKMGVKINEILNADQKIKFLEMKENIKKGKKSKKKGKDKETAPQAPTVAD